MSNNTIPVVASYKPVTLSVADWLGSTQASYVIKLLSDRISFFYSSINHDTAYRATMSITKTQRRNERKAPSSYSQRKVTLESQRTTEVGVFLL